MCSTTGRRSQYASKGADGCGSKSYQNLGRVFAGKEREDDRTYHRGGRDDRESNYDSAVNPDIRLQAAPDAAHWTSQLIPSAIHHLMEPVW